MFPLPTDTAHVQIESVQYSIFNVDLGEGVRRRILGIGAVILVPWTLLMLFLHVTSVWMYVTVPGLLIWQAVRKGPGGRPNYVWLADQIRYLARRHRRVINPVVAGQPRTPRPYTLRPSFTVLPAEFNLKGVGE